MLDAVIIGGGIAGTIFLKTAVEKKLNVMLLEKQEGVGGKWRELPAWQDIQMRPEDWSLNGVEITGVRRSDIIENAQNWIKKYNLQHFLSFGTEVTKVEWKDDHWQISTNKGEFSAKNLIVATGILNSANVPDIPKVMPTVKEFHSSTFPDVKALKSKRVVIVGGAHSAWDLLDHAIEQEASEIHWIYRNPRWMVPSNRPKYERTDVRKLALGQVTHRSVDNLSKLYEKYVKNAYVRFGIQEIMPTGEFHLERNLLVGGRPLMIQNFHKIKRYQGTIESIEGNRVKTGNKDIECDLILYATGYKTQMKFLGLPSVDSIAGQKQILARCKIQCQSMDFPNLYFVGPTGVEANTALPLYAAIISKTIVAAIQGKVKFPDKIITRRIVHWDLIKILARFDRVNYSYFWRIKYYVLAWFYWKFYNRQIRL